MRDYRLDALVATYVAGIVDEHPGRCSAIMRRIYFSLLAHAAGTGQRQGRRIGVPFPVHPRDGLPVKSRGISVPLLPLPTARQMTSVNNISDGSGGNAETRCG